MTAHTTMERRHTPKAPPYPGSILRSEFIEPLGMTQADVARATDIPYRRLNEVVRGARSVTPSTALRLARYLGTTPQFWMHLQADVDLYLQQQQDAETLAAITPVSSKRAEHTATTDE